MNTGTSATPVWTSTGDMVAGPLATFTTPHTRVAGRHVLRLQRLLRPAHSAVGAHGRRRHLRGLPRQGGDRAAQTALKETSNHSFVVDSTVCANCHTANVDGVALQAANQMQLDSSATCGPPSC